MVQDFGDATNVSIVSGAMIPCEFRVKRKARMMIGQVSNICQRLVWARRRIVSKIIPMIKAKIAPREKVRKRVIRSKKKITR